MAAYNKFRDFVEQLGLEGHQLNTDVLKIYLSNVQPVVTNTVFGTPAEFAGGTGYTARGEDIQNTWSENPAGTGELIGTKVVWTAGAADWAAFQFVVLFNETNATDMLIGWWDYASALTLGNGETFTVKFNNGDPTGIVLTLT
jgi:hypothetical protein